LRIQVTLLLLRSSFDSSRVASPGDIYGGVKCVNGYKKLLEKFIDGEGRPQIGRKLIEFWKGNTIMVLKQHHFGAKNHGQPIGKERA
jgi:hypothetical protein